MRQSCVILAAVLIMFAPTGWAQQDGPYKVLKTARVGGEGGWDYIFADPAGRRLYIPRGANTRGRSHRTGAGGPGAIDDLRPRYPQASR